MNLRVLQVLNSGIVVYQGHVGFFWRQYKGVLEGVGNWV